MLLEECCSLLRDARARLAAAAKKLYAMAYLAIIYLQFVWIDAVERHGREAQQQKKKLDETLEIRRAELLFDYDEHALSAAADADPASPSPAPATALDITQQIDRHGATLSDEELRANPFAKLEDWQLIAGRLLGEEACPSRRIRCEVRYALGGAKYRRVLFWDDDATLDPCIPREVTEMPPRAHIIQAKLCGPDAEIDVTARVRRYLGPSGDWHRTKALLARDLFPHDRHDSNAESFDRVRIVDGLATYHVVPYPDGPLPDLSS